MITCPQCNAQNLPGMAYCENCGSPLPQQGAPAAAPAAPAPPPIIDATALPASAPPDPAAVALPQPVMPVDQPLAGPDLPIPSPADGANVVAAEPEESAPQAPIAMPAAATASAPPQQTALPSQSAPPDQGAATFTPSAPPAPAPAPAATPAQPSVAATAGATLTITFPSGQVFTMQGDEVNVGRADVAQNWHPELDVIPYGGGAPDLGVSRHHARISRQDGRFTVVDVGSTNGTYVNGHAATYNQPADLNDGDTLSFGALNTQVAIK